MSMNNQTAYTYAKLVEGCPQMEDYTPGADVAAGDVVVTSGTPRVALRPIASGVLGALAGRDGVYRLPKATNLNIGDNVKVYWDATNHVGTTTSSLGTQFGFSNGATVSANTTFLATHSPN